MSTFNIIDPVNDQLVGHLSGKDSRLYEALTKRKKIEIPDIITGQNGAICSSCVITGTVNENHIEIDHDNGLVVYDTLHNTVGTFQLDGEITSGRLQGISGVLIVENGESGPNYGGITFKVDGKWDIYVEGFAAGTFTINNGFSIIFPINTTESYKMDGTIIITTSAQFTGAGGVNTVGNINTDGNYQIDSNEVISAARVFSGSGGVNTLGNINTGGQYNIDETVVINSSSAFVGFGGINTAGNINTSGEYQMDSITLINTSASFVGSAVNVSGTGAFGGSVTITSANLIVSSGFGIENGGGESLALRNDTAAIEGYLNSTNKFRIDNSSSTTTINLHVWYNGALTQLTVDASGFVKAF